MSHFTGEGALGGESPTRGLRAWLGVGRVGHQAPSPDIVGGGPAGAAEEIAIERIVRAREDRLLAAVATLADMVRRMGNDDPGETGHARTPGMSLHAVNKVHCRRNST